MNEKFYHEHTFCPKTNVDKSKLGDLNNFIEYQMKHIKKITDKVTKFKDDRESKNIINPHPKIDEVSSF